MEDQLEAIAQLVDSLVDEGIDYWLFGGWAVDFHVGKVTRSHADIDVAIWLADADRLGSVLGRLDWRHTPSESEGGYTTYQRDDVKFEVASLPGTGNPFTRRHARDEPPGWTARAVTRPGKSPECGPASSAMTR
jgi:hypothetical protein